LSRGARRWRRGSAPNVTDLMHEGGATITAQLEPRIQQWLGALTGSDDGFYALRHASLLASAAGDAAQVPHTDAPLGPASGASRGGGAAS
jgi:hypothetical protein